MVYQDRIYKISNFQPRDFIQRSPSAENQWVEIGSNRRLILSIRKVSVSIAHFFEEWERVINAAVNREIKLEPLPAELPDVPLAQA